MPVSRSQRNQLKESFLRRTPEDRQEAERQSIIRSIKLVRPLFFWRRCMKCNCDFKRAPMWKLCFSFLYVCCACMPDREEAADFLKSCCFNRRWERF